MAGSKWIRPDGDQFVPKIKKYPKHKVELPPKKKAGKGRK